MQKGERSSWTFYKLGKNFVFQEHFLESYFVPKILLRYLVSEQKNGSDLVTERRKKGFSSLIMMVEDAFMKILEFSIFLFQKLFFYFLFFSLSSSHFILQMHFKKSLFSLKDVLMFRNLRKKF